MKNLEFPITGTKAKGLTKRFDIESPEGREPYFEAKVGDEIKHIKDYLNSGRTFLAYFLGKKSSGKGTYSKLLAEIFGEDKIAHISVGDLIREIDNWKSFEKTKRHDRMKKYYRGYTPWEDAVKAHFGRSTTKLLPTEFILALLKAHIDELAGKAIFIDGMPRQVDQISYSLYFRDVINYRDDPDLFILIDIPESVIEERMKYRVTCPICQTSRNKKLLITSKIEYDEKLRDYFLVCDNPTCKGARMVGKEGDDKGLDPIRNRLNRDEDLLRIAFKLYGIPKILLRNHVPVSEAGKYFENYEITPAYSFKRSSDGGVEVVESPFTVQDDNGTKVYSLLAAPVVVSLIKQLYEVLQEV